jgi:glycyl-tRNA synthetase beta chain
LTQAKAKNIVWSDQFNAEMAVEDAERALWDQLQQYQSRLDELLKQKNYGQLMRELVNLKNPVDAFFEKVMVMAEDPAIRANRLSLMSVIQRVFRRIADFSELQDFSIKVLDKI